VDEGRDEALLKAARREAVAVAVVASGDPAEV
jgi:hypothetical protein